MALLSTKRGYRSTTTAKRISVIFQISLLMEELESRQILELADVSVSRITETPYTESFPHDPPPPHPPHFPHLAPTRCHFLRYCIRKKGNLCSVPRCLSTASPPEMSSRSPLVRSRRRQKLWTTEMWWTLWSFKGWFVIHLMPLTLGPCPRTTVGYSS